MGRYASKFLYNCGLADSQLWIHVGSYCPCKDLVKFFFCFLKRKEKKKTPLLRLWLASVSEEYIVSMKNGRMFSHLEKAQHQRFIRIKKLWGTSKLLILRKKVSSSLLPIKSCPDDALWCRWGSPVGGSPAWWGRLEFRWCGSYVKKKSSLWTQSSFLWHEETERHVWGPFLSILFLQH